MNEKLDLEKMHFYSVIWGIFLVILVILLTVVGFYFKFQTKEYKKYEDAIEEKMKNYIFDNALLYEETYLLSDLLEKQIIDTTKVNEKDCSGYVEVKVLESNDVEITPYIKCGKYQTRGYKE